VLLTTLEQKTALFKRYGVDGCLVLPFNRKFAGSSPERFIRLLLDNVPALKRVFIGSNWRFGKGGAGTPELFAEICLEAGVKTSVVASVKSKGLVVSSTAVRDAVVKGAFDEAALLLGRDYSLSGVVVRGRTVGRQLGYPTVNLKTDNEVLFPGGVYAVEVLVGDRGRKRLRGVLNYGTRPTFKDNAGHEATLEIHLLDIDRDLYGSKIEVFLKKGIRKEKKFSSADVLRRQIMRDVEKALEIL
jgi:riboflavin kinase/FMN adenylyltransferase